MFRERYTFLANAALKHRLLSFNLSPPYLYRSKMSERFCEQKPRLSHIDTEYKTLLLHHVKKREKEKKIQPVRC